MQMGSINKSPGEIKRREVSWTLTKSWRVIKLCGSSEIKKREVALDPQESPGEIKSREVEVTGSWTTRPFFFSWSSTAVRRAKRAGFDNFVS